MKLSLALSMLDAALAEARRLEVNVCVSIVDAAAWPMAFARDLIVIRMDFAKSQKAVAVAAIFYKGGLQAWLYANNAGKVDVPFKLLFGSRFNIIIFKPISVHHNNARFFRVCCVDQHTL